MASTGGVSCASTSDPASGLRRVTDHPRAVNQAPALRCAVVAVTGGIASGKSAVTRLFEARGVPVVDTDVLAREVIAPGSTGLEEIRAAFGADVFAADGGLDRRALRERVFANPAERRLLESITHPRIRALARERLAALHAPYALLVIPLLAEGGRYDFIDRVLVIDVSPAVQHARLVQRDGITPALADAMIAAQASRAERLALADDVLANEGSLDALESAVVQLHERYLAWSRTRSRHDA